MESRTAKEQNRTELECQRQRLAHRPQNVHYV